MRIILLVVLLAGCASKPVQQTGTEHVVFWLHKVERARLEQICYQRPHMLAGSTMYRLVACELAGNVIMQVRWQEQPSKTRHTVTIHRYPWNAAPCIACVIDGEVHAAIGDGWWWGGLNAARLGDAIIETTGAPVGYNNAWRIAHEVGHVLDQPHSH